VITFSEIGRPSSEVTVLVDSSLTWWWGWWQVVRWATIIKDSDGRQIVIFGTSTGESAEVVVTVSELGLPTGEVVLVDDGTAVTLTLNLDG
jgi:hypothetical protein